MGWGLQGVWSATRQFQPISPKFTRQSKPDLFTILRDFVGRSCGDSNSSAGGPALHRWPWRCVRLWCWVPAWPCLQVRTTVASLLSPTGFKILNVGENWSWKSLQKPAKQNQHDWNICHAHCWKISLIKTSIALDLEKSAWLKHQLCLILKNLDNSNICCAWSWKIWIIQTSVVLALEKSASCSTYSYQVWSIVKVTRHERVCKFCYVCHIFPILNASQVTKHLVFFVRFVFNLRVETYLHEKQWEKAVVTLDIQMQQPTPSTQLQLLKVKKKKKKKKDICVKECTYRIRVSLEIFYI